MAEVHTTSFDAKADIVSIIHGAPAAPLSQLPHAWHELAAGPADTGLDADARADYVQAARLFRYHNTPLAMESLATIGKDFGLRYYPELPALAAKAQDSLQQKTIAAVSVLFNELGYSVPAAFYNVLLATAMRDDNHKLMGMFRDKTSIQRDRLWDAVLHAVLLVTPIGLYVQSVFSQHGLRFMHVMDCGCKISMTSEPAFTVALDSALKPAYLQNMLAAAFEQYGVNAETSRKSRGF